MAIVRFRLARLRLLGAREVQVVLPLPAGGQRLERRPETRVLVEAAVELLAGNELVGRADLEACFLDSDGLVEIGIDGVGQSGHVVDRGEPNVAGGS